MRTPLAVPAYNQRNLPIIDCPSLNRLVHLISTNGAQAAVVLDPATEKPYKPGDGEGVQLTDLLQVTSDLFGRVTAVRARKPFYWRLWDFGVDLTENLEAHYDFSICLRGIEIGEMRQNGARPRFSGVVILDEVVFDTEANFRGAQFMAEAWFAEAVFMQPARFEQARFVGGADFWQAHFMAEAGFWKAQFEGDVHFRDTNDEGRGWSGDMKLVKGLGLWDNDFLGKAKYRDKRLVGSARFRDAHFAEEAVFANTELTRDISFLNARIERSLFLNQMRLNAADGAQLIDLSDCTVNSTVAFDLARESTGGYGDVVFGLHNSNLSYFRCNDRAFGLVGLFEDPGVTGATASRETVRRLERYLQELRLKRKILQDMNWGDLADDCYAVTMDVQLDLDRMTLRLGTIGNRALWLVRKLVYQLAFGWGIRLRNGATTSVGALVVFWVAFCTLGLGWWGGKALHQLDGDWAVTSLIYSIEAFLGIAVPSGDGLPTQFGLLGTFETAVGYVLSTVFVLILARKFMRL